MHLSLPHLRKSDVLISSRFIYNIKNFLHNPFSTRGVAYSPLPFHFSKYNEPLPGVSGKKAINFLGKWEQKENKTGNTGTRA